VCILVGQRLGGDRPDLAEKTAYTGLKWTFGYLCVVAAIYLTMPRLLVSLFQGDRDIKNFEAVAAIVPGLLVCVAAYSLVESLNFTFGFALRGAGDTRFVTLVTFCLAWPIMVLPTYLVVQAGGDVKWAWWFATAHIFAMGTCFFLRFRTGKWKSMRVIEPGLEAAA
jgi:multidrug resistance protein, MATE family